MLQMLNAYFTAPRMDEQAYSAFKKRMEAVLKNRDSSPGTAFNDTLNALLTQHDPREKPTTFDDLQKMDMNFSQQFFNERFADGNDFTFIFVGNFKADSIKSMLETYLGSIPVLPSDESWAPETYNYPAGVHKRSVYKGIEDKSQVALVFTGDCKWSVENQFKALALADVMRIRLRERLREDKGGTYGVGVSAQIEHFPLERYNLSISFGTDPEKVDELKNEVFVQIDSLRNFGASPDYLEKVKESFSRNHETNLRSNSYWLNKIENSYFQGLHPEYILDTQHMIENLSLDDIHKAAQQYLDVNNYIEVVLYPQKEQVP
jgi:zinc protease